jgi:hypothetical protein
MPAPTALHSSSGNSISVAANAEAVPGKLSSVFTILSCLLINQTGDNDFILNLNSPLPSPDAHQPATTPSVHLETRKIPIPPHRFTPIKAAWPKIYPPLCEHLRLQVRMNIKNKAIELRTSRFTSDPGALQKGEDFARALTYGFDVDDAICLIRLDGLYD